MLFNKYSIGEWDVAAARQLSLHSQAAYSTTAYRCERVIAGSHSVDISTFDRDCVIAFRGTDDAADWLTNLEVDRVKQWGCKVHSGFSGVEKRLTHQIAQVLPEAQRYWITGHSLGGALATLFAVRLSDARFNVAGLYTFGSPRVGCRCFAQHADYALKGRHFRVVHGNDIVPRVPRPIRFRHCGQQVYIDRKGRAVLSPGVFSQFADRVLGYRFDLVRDHFIDSYVQALRGIA